MDDIKAALEAALGFSGGPLIYDADKVGALTAAIESNSYAVEHMANRPRFANRLELLRFAVAHAPTQGLVLEFGVHSGTTINLIAALRPSQPVHGFDSFQGLPEAWVHAPAGTFARPDLPKVQPNVELVVGWFDRTLPTFLDSHPGPAALIHVDCDLYSSTQTVLAQLKTRIGAGTIIVFDEYFNYPGWKQHEYLAFKQFIEATGKKYEYIGLVPAFQHVAVRMLS